MKALLINGSPHENGCTFTALHRIAETLELQDVSTEIFHIGKTPVGGCMDCGYCAEKKICVIDDCVNRALKKAEEADGFVFGTPVYFASPNGSMVAFMDRFFKAGDFPHKPAAVAASARRGGCTAALEVLIKYPTYNQMPLVSADYWPIIHGNTPEEVLRDEEGLHTMETLGLNMAWLLKCIENGEKPVKREKSIWTNFIR